MPAETQFEYMFEPIPVNYHISQDVNHINLAKLEHYLLLITALEDNLAEYMDIKKDLTEVSVSVCLTGHYLNWKKASLDTVTWVSSFGLVFVDCLINENDLYIWIRLLFLAIRYWIVSCLKELTK